jgi:hypothetical protein
MDASSSNNMLYLPVDRLGQGGSQTTPPPPMTLQGDQRGSGTTPPQNDPRSRTGREDR